jgi:hypothetical protein
VGRESRAIAERWPATSVESRAREQIVIVLLGRLFIRTAAVRFNSAKVPVRMSALTTGLRIDR